MDPAPPSRRAREIFEGALDLDLKSGQESHIRLACGDDPELAQQVRALLEAHEAGESFLPSQPRSGTIDVRITEQPGDRIGRYKLLEKIGEGGCGVVYMAEQEEPVRRKVALKIIKPGMDSKSVIARFEAERQALALMDHPNIAKVFDGGVTGGEEVQSSNFKAQTSTGRPYFVMELVRGVRITDYCEQHNLSTKERLDLFILVCQAVQHAHQKGIIHRDLKPSNILVSENDGKPVPKVIDFGIAKATEQKLTDKTLFTQFAQFMGTPAYMSPEQAAMTVLDVDTRSDIYSLGVLLYELLTGSTPFDAQELVKAGFDEMRRVIRETEPERPSTRLTRLRYGVPASAGPAIESSTRPKTSDTPPAEAGTPYQRKPFDAQPKSLSTDLDWIVMKCLEKERSRRYETANGLAMDIQRHLSNEPVVARPPSTAYRFRKMVRRNQGVFVASAAVSTAVVIGLGVSIWQSIEKDRAYSRARIEAAKSQQVARVFKEMLSRVGPTAAAGRDTRMLREILDSTADRIATELRDQPEVDWELKMTIGRVYRDLGEYAKAEAVQREALAIARRLWGGEHLNVASSLEGLGGALERQNKLAEAEAVDRDALAMRRKLQGPQNADVAMSLKDLGWVLHSRGRHAEAEAVTREALEMQRKVLGNEDVEVASALNNLGDTLHSQGRLPEAETAFRESLAMRRKLLGQQHVHVAVSLRSLAWLLQRRGQYAEAEVMTREVLEMQIKLLGNDHVDVASTLNNLAAVLGAQGKLAEAENLHREVLQRRRKLLGNEHSEVAASLYNLAIVLTHQEKLSEAEGAFREALGMHRKTLGDEHPYVADSLHSLTAVLDRQQKFVEAEATAREALAIKRKAFGDEHRELAPFFENLFVVLTHQNKLAEAERLGRETLAMWTKLLGAEHATTIRMLATVEDLLESQNQLVETESLLSGALVAASNPPEKSIVHLRMRGEFRARHARWKEAAEDFAKAVAIDPRDHELRLELLPLLVQSRDLDAYRQQRQSVLEFYKGTNDPVVAERMAKACLFLPMSDAGLEITRQWGDTAIAAGTNHGAWTFFQFVSGLSEYRLGRFPAAVQSMQTVLLKRGEHLPRDAQAFAILAMARHRLGDNAPARAALAQADEIMASKFTKPDTSGFGDGWADWIIAQTLLREAKELSGDESSKEREKK